jgi:hypothetical protein
MKILDLEKSTSLYTLPLSGSSDTSKVSKLEDLLEYVARLLPAEGPIASFVFLNPLHAFEYLPYDTAVKKGARLFACQPYLGEDRYRHELATKRIQMVDLRSILEEDEEHLAWTSVSGIVKRLNLRLTMLQTPVCFGTTREMRWFVSETRAFTKFREHTTEACKKQIVSDVKRWVIRDLTSSGSTEINDNKSTPDDPRQHHILWPLFPSLKKVLAQQEKKTTDALAESIWEAFSLKALWRVCYEGVSRVRPTIDAEPESVRLRDGLLEATGVDSDLLVHDLLIRFAAAFTDQGLASWPLPLRDEGFFKGFCKLYSLSHANPAKWTKGLARELKKILENGLSPVESIYHSLAALGIDEADWEALLLPTMLTLKGWGSMIRQMEVRADRVPSPVPVGTLTEFLAIRLILERYAIAHIARNQLHYRGPLSGLHALLKTSQNTSKESTTEERAFPVFQLAQVLGWSPSVLHEFTDEQWAELIGEIESFNAVERRRIFHLAFERRYRIQALDAFSAKVVEPIVPRTREPKFQVFTCIDTREESFRRHLEEVCPEVETFGIAGFFSVPIYYRGIADAHAVASCPIVIMPQHTVVEEPIFSLTSSNKSRAQVRRIIGTTSHRFHRGSRTFALGALFTGTLGIGAAIPLVSRVLFPRWTSWISTFANSFVAPPPVTRLALERGDENDVHNGFSLEEMARIGETVLRDTGLTNNFSRLVIFLGHGSECMNNPHKSAYDCGACSGNPSGPNARSLAMILNDHRVRSILDNNGLKIPPDTIFLGGHHNTAEDVVSFFDLDLMPRSHMRDLISAQESLKLACERNSQERCRRFFSAPLNISGEAAITHVHARTQDLAQTRPEFGNATNALCFVGRRDRIRGLFMDRRCFMQSYDASQDDDKNTILARILHAVIPVCEGINLMYNFSSMDSAGWGAGTKLPHNVTSLLGVMDGAQSDLRQGLPWQGVEIHEPIRLLFIIETTPDALFGIMESNPVIGRILRNKWAQLAVLSPTSPQLQLFQDGAFVPYHPTSTKLAKATSSIEWFSGRRDNLEFAEIVDSVDSVETSPASDIGSGSIIESIA